MKHRDFIKDVEDKVCARYNLKSNMFSSRVRRRVNSEARFAVWYLLYFIYNLSSLEIGRLYGYDHTTVLHGIKRAQDIGIDKELVEYLAIGVTKSVDNGGIVNPK